LKRKGLPLDGVLLLDKPRGLTSNSALQRARKLLGAAKAGHTGTLDPMASGLLPICLGQATKFSGFLLEADKTYEATVTLGAATETGDAEGRIVRTGSLAAVDRQGIEAVLAVLTGPIEQLPPMHSALKHKGRPLYQYARAGLTVERHARAVTVHEIRLTRLDSPELDIQVTVSKGTYIRALAAELGERLGCGAYLSALRRTAAGGLHLDEALSLPALEAMPEGQRRAQVRPIDLLLRRLPALTLNEQDVASLLQGRAIATDTAPSAQALARLYDGRGAFLGIGELILPGQLTPRRLMSRPPQTLA
jgi:tRNA pseudouridine55 synthase